MTDTITTDDRQLLQLCIGQPTPCGDVPTMLACRELVNRKLMTVKLMLVDDGEITFGVQFFQTSDDGRVALAKGAA